MTENSSSDFEPNKQALFDLIIKKATVGLDPSEQQQLATDPETDREALRIESAAAAFHLALTSEELTDSMPSSLQDRLEQDAKVFFSQEAAAAPSAVNEAVQETSSSSTAARTPKRPDGQVGSLVTRREVVAMVIAAVCLLMVFTGLNPLTFNPNATKTPTERLASLRSSPPSDLLDLEFAGVHQSEASGRVIWSDDKQEGYMLLKGLRDNDPNVSQYQLWIFDTDKAQKYPVDGGVFDYAKTQANDQGEVLIPIDARIPVKKAVQFAVTEEIPGGVVVSERKKIPVLAKTK